MRCSDYTLKWEQLGPDLKVQCKWGLVEPGQAVSFPGSPAGEDQERLQNPPVEIPHSAPIQDTAIILVERVEPGRRPGIGYPPKYRCHELNFPLTVP